MKAARKLTVAVKPIPEGYHSITPFLTVRGGDRAIDFYRRAFGAKVTVFGVYLPRESSSHGNRSVDASSYTRPTVSCR